MVVLVSLGTQLVYRANAETDFIYFSNLSECAPAYKKTSWTPAFARNSRVYSISGVFASGRRHCILIRCASRKDNGGSYEETYSWRV